MWVLELLKCARDGKPLNTEALRQFVRGVATGSIPDYQAAAFLMAVYQRGLSDADTAALTLAMRDCGRQIDLSHIKGLKVDKHSTGGVGDKLSLPLAPWVAACGVTVPMVGGRGLGHTGGTLDKLESIAGFNVGLTIDAFVDNVQKVGVCIMGQTQDLAPADKVLYALRDVTATVESTPLITASILAKKLSEGIDALVLDVKVGSGAFMKDLGAARALALSLIRVGHQAGTRVRALITDMNAPLGRAIGNALEVKEAIALLHGRGPDAAMALTRTLGAHMLVMGQAAGSLPEAENKLDEALRSGQAWQKFRQMVVAQGGDVRVVDEPERLPMAAHQTVLRAGQAGYVQRLDAYDLGHAAMMLGAGRSTKQDKIDAAVGLQLEVDVGTPVDAQQPLVTIHHNAPLTDEVLHLAQHAMVIGDQAVVQQNQILDVLGD